MPIRNLPTNKAADSHPSPATSLLNLPTLKLLMLEDDPSDAEFITVMLRRSGLSFSAQVATDENDCEVEAVIFDVVAGLSTVNGQQ